MKSRSLFRHLKKKKMAQKAFINNYLKHNMRRAKYWQRQIQRHARPFVEKLSDIGLI